MYNEQWKRKFINSFTNSAGSATTYERLFNRFESREKELDKDLACMSEEEIRVALNSVTGLSTASTTRSIVILRAYVSWCIKNRMKCVSDVLLSLYPDTSERMTQKMYASPEALNDAMNTVFSPVEDKTVHNIYRCYMWLCYMGLSIREIELLKKSQVDFSRSTVEFGMYGYKIYMEAIQTFESCVKQKSFVSFHPRYPYKPVVKQRVLSELLLSRTDNSVSVPELNKLISAVKGADGLPHSHRNLYRSGVFHRMLMRERAGFPVDFAEEAMKAIYDDRSDANDCGDKERLTRITNQLRRVLEKDYCVWKNAFYGE